MSPLATLCRALWTMRQFGPSRARPDALRRLQDRRLRALLRHAVARSPFYRDKYRGLDVGRVTQLRSKARKSGLYLRVLKNTLARRAIQGTPFEKLSDQMVGPLMYGIAQDPVAGAKVLSEFAKDNEQFVIKAGAMPNAMMSAQDVKALALLPSREELLARLLGTMQAPVAKLVRTMNEVPAKFVRTLAPAWDADKRPIHGGLFRINGDGTFPAPKDSWPRFHRRDG